MVDLNFKYRDAITFLKKESPFTPDVAIVLGSGLGNFADSTNKVKTILTSDIPKYPSAAVEGHKGLIHLSKIGNKKLIISQRIMTVLQNFFYFLPGFKDVNPSRTGRTFKYCSQLIRGITLISPKIDGCALLWCKSPQKIVRQRKFAFRVHCIIRIMIAIVFNFLFIIKILVQVRRNICINICTCSFLC